MKHVAALKRALGIGAVLTEESTWQYRPTNGDDQGAQVDLVIDRNDACINLCEIKFSEAGFVIDKACARALQNKRATFNRVTRTRKSTFLTLITTHGVRNNRYFAELGPECVTMDALFV